MERQKNLIWYVSIIAVVVVLLVNGAALVYVFQVQGGQKPVTEPSTETHVIHVRAAGGEVSQLNWAGKTWCSYGDSITQEGTWQSYVTEYFGFARHDNRGIGSSTFARNDQIWYANPDGTYNSRPGFAGVTQAPEGTTEHEGYLCSGDRISVSVPADADLIVVMGGTNDMGSNVPLGDLSTPFDETTFRGAVAATVVKLQQQAPGAVIVLASPLNGRAPETANGDGSEAAASNGDADAFAVNELGLTTKDYRDAMEEVAQSLGVPFIDVYGTAGINQWNRSHYLRDGVHPSDQGGMAVARAMIGGLEQIKPNLISRYSAAAGQVLADSAAVKETADGNISAELNQVRWSREEKDGQICLTGRLPQAIETGVFSMTASDTAYLGDIRLEVSGDGEDWQPLYDGLDYEIWGDTLWASFGRREVSAIRLRYEAGGGGCMFRFDLYQPEGTSDLFDAGSRVKTLTASVSSDQTGNMTDHDAATRWSSGTAQEAGVWIMAELTENCNLDGIHLDVADSIGDYPRGLHIEVSEDGTNWTGVDAVSEDQIDFSFSPVTCRYLRMTLDQPPEETMANWSVHEMILYMAVE